MPRSIMTPLRLWCCIPSSFPARPGEFSTNNGRFLMVFSLNPGTASYNFRPFSRNILTLPWSSSQNKTLPAPQSHFPLHHSALGTKKAGIEFVYSAQGAGLFFPEDYEAFVKAILPEKTSPARVISCYAKRLTSPEASVRNAACAAYLRWVMRLLSLCPDENIIEEIASKPEEAGPGPAIEMNYMAKLRCLKWRTFWCQIHFNHEVWNHIL